MGWNIVLCRIVMIFLKLGLELVLVKFDSGLVMVSILFRKGKVVFVDSIEDRIMIKILMIRQVSVIGQNMLLVVFQFLKKWNLWLCMVRVGVLDSLIVRQIVLMKIFRKFRYMIRLKFRVLVICVLFDKVSRFLFVMFSVINRVMMLKQVVISIMIYMMFMFSSWNLLLLKWKGMIGVIFWCIRKCSQVFWNIKLVMMFISLVRNLLEYMLNSDCRMVNVVLLLLMWLVLILIIKLISLE